MYSSPLLRARQTARVLSRYHGQVPIRTSSLLLEVRTSYQGEPNTVLKPGFSFYDPVRSPDDETMAQIFARMLRFLRAVARRHAGGIVVAVTHADPIAIMRVGLEGLEFTSKNLHATVYPMRASVTQLSLKPNLSPELLYFNVAGATS